MATPKNVNESEIKAAISAIMKRKRPDIAQLRLGERARLKALRGKLEKRLEPLFAEAGLDTAKINEIIAEYQSEVGDVLEKKKAKYAKALPALNKDLRRGIENRRKALEQLVFKPPTITPIPLWTAFDIVEDPGTVPFASHMEVANNWVVTTFEKGTDGRGLVDYIFWFAWQNPSQDLTVIALADIVVQGTCKAASKAHFLGDGYGSLDLRAQLIAYTGIYPNEGNTVDIQYLEVSAANPPASVTISDTYHLLGPGVISVSGGSLVLFAVHFSVGYNVDNGSVSYDFESPGFIMCPGVQVFSAS